MWMNEQQGWNDEILPQICPELPIHTIMENSQEICSQAASLVAVGWLSVWYRFLNRLIHYSTLKAARRETKSHPFPGDTVVLYWEAPDEQQNSPQKILDFTKNN